MENTTPEVERNADIALPGPPEIAEDVRCPHRVPCHPPCRKGPGPAEPHRERTTGIGVGHCVGCGLPWPCDAARLRQALAWLIRYRDTTVIPPADIAETLHEPATQRAILRAGEPAGTREASAPSAPPTDRTPPASGGVISKEDSESIGRSIGRTGCVIRD